MESDKSDLERSNLNLSPCRIIFMRSVPFFMDCGRTLQEAKLLLTFEAGINEWIGDVEELRVLEWRLPLFRAE
jgi:hypothetical protein